MRVSVLQMTAILCLLALGFMGMGPFMQTAEAHDYTVVVMYYNAYICSDCGAEKYRELVGASSYTASHSGTGSHQEVSVRSHVTYIYD